MFEDKFYFNPTTLEHKVQNLAVCNGRLYASQGTSNLYVEEGGTWVECTGISPQDLREYKVYERAMVVHKNDLYVGCNWGCIYKGTNNKKEQLLQLQLLRNGEAWEYVQALAYYPLFLLVGTNVGLLLSTDKGKSFIKPSGIIEKANIFSLCIANDVFYAGTYKSGVLGSLDGKEWGKWNKGLSTGTEQFIYSLHAHHNKLFAGTCWQGIYYTDLTVTDKPNWRPCNQGLRNDYDVLSSPVYCFTSFENYLFAGTINGIFISTNEGKSWTYISKDITGTAIMALQVHNDHLYVGTQEKGLWKSGPLSTILVQA